MTVSGTAEHHGERPGQRPGERPDRKSTRHFRVNRRRARTLADLHPDFDSVDILESLENFPVKGAIGLLEWAAKADNPRKKLRNWARKAGKGHYHPAMLSKPAEAVYREYMAAVREERAAAEERTGSDWLSQKRIDRVTQEIYGPRTRATVALISEATWRSYHEDLEREEQAA